MTPDRLLAHCCSRNIRLAARDDRLYVNAPTGSLTPELLARLRACKAGLLRLLHTPEPEPAGDAFAGQAVSSDSYAMVLASLDDFESLDLGDWSCPLCTTLAFWRDATGGKHCMSCEAKGLRRSLRLAEWAAKQQEATR